MQNFTLHNSLPSDLERLVGNDTKDFVVKAKRAFPAKQSIFFFLFSGFWLFVTTTVFFAIMGPFFRGENFEYTTNGVPRVVEAGDYAGMFFPLGFFAIFFMVGLIMFSIGAYKLFSKGAWFVGTPGRLIILKNKNMRSIDWEQFSGDIAVSTDSAGVGTLTFGMRTGQMASSKNSGPGYVPDYIYIASVPNALAVEQICRRRIKENDPTLAKSENKFS